MESQVFSKVIVESENKVKSVVGFKQHRYLYKELQKTNNDFYVGIYGLRGIGKTVLLLQLASSTKKSLYVSADAVYLSNYSIYEIAEEAANRGYKNLFIDEIHTRTNWTADLKTLFDEGRIHIVFTGSSAANVKRGADLSRRVIMHELLPPSLREFLNIKLNAGAEKVSIHALFNESTRKNIAVKYTKWLTYWQDYYRYGGVLYDAKVSFPKPVMSAIERIINVDLASVRQIDSAIVNDVYKMLYKIAKSGPYEMSYNNLADYVGVSVKTVINLVKDLEKVGLLKLVYPYKGGFRKEPKLYFRLPFRSAINESLGLATDIGVAREEFFANNVPLSGYVKTERGTKTPDFIVDGKTIEVGGTGKTNYQKADFLAIDDTDFIGNKIPLALFGFLY